VLKREADQDLVGAVRAVGRGDAFLTNAADGPIIREWMEDGAKGPAVPLTRARGGGVKLIAEATRTPRSPRSSTRRRRPSSRTAPTCSQARDARPSRARAYAIRRGLVERRAPKPTMVAVRAPVDTSPPAVFRRSALAPRPVLRMDQQTRAAVLIEFWGLLPSELDAGRSVPEGVARALRRARLRVIGVHVAGFEPSVTWTRSAPRRAARVPTRLLSTPSSRSGRSRQPGWPRVSVRRDGMLFEHHYGEGGYADTSSRSRSCSGSTTTAGRAGPARGLPGACSRPEGEDVEGEYSGPYHAGGVWAVLERRRNG